MANAQAVCTSFKTELLGAYHNFIATNVARTINTIDVFKAALFVATGARGAATTAYSTTDEVTGTNYTAGGVTVTNATVPAATGTTTFWTPSASFAWTTVTLAIAFDAVLIYNSSQASRAVSVHTFGSQTVTAGNFTLTMPTNDATTGLLRLA